jgi:protein required for attachment to host cells
MKPVRTLVLLANDHEARLLENGGVGKGLHQVRHLDRDSVSGAEIAYASQPGRSHGGQGSARHGLAPSTSEEVQNRQRFAAALADIVDHELGAGGYDRLILSAPAKMLGVLRSGLSVAAKSKIVADLDKDLMHTRLEDLAGHFSEVAAF